MPESQKYRRIVSGDKFCSICGGLSFLFAQSLELSQVLIGFGSLRKGRKRHSKRGGIEEGLETTLKKSISPANGITAAEASYLITHQNLVISYQRI
jgi:hypothetical protein